MKDSVGGAVIPSLGTVSLGGYSSGWGGSYDFSNNPTNYKTPSVENVSFTDYTTKYFDPKVIEWYYTYLLEPIAKMSSKTVIGEGVKLITGPLNDLLASKMSLGGAVLGEIVTTVIFGSVTGSSSKEINNIAGGKGFDWNHLVDEFAKAGVKALPKVAVSVPTMLITTALYEIDHIDLSNIDVVRKYTFDKKGTITDPIKILTNALDAPLKEKIMDEIPRLGELDELIKNQNDLIKNLQSAGQSTKVAKAELKTLLKEQRIITDKQMLNERLAMTSQNEYTTVTMKSYVPGGEEFPVEVRVIPFTDRLNSSLSFVKNYGAGMAAGIGLDTVVSIGGNILKNKLIDGMTWGDALANCDWGAEFLKASCKGVCGTAGSIIGGAFGNAQLGKTIGSAIGGFVGDFAVKPFTLEDGTIEQTWCLAAGCAVIGGAILGGAIAAAIVCGCTPPIGWVVGAAMIVGAAICYGIVILVHWLCG